MTRDKVLHRENPGCRLTSARLHHAFRFVSGSYVYRKCSVANKAERENTIAFFPDDLGVLAPSFNLLASIFFVGVHLTISSAAPTYLVSTDSGSFKRVGNEVLGAYELRPYYS